MDPRFLCSDHGIYVSPSTFAYAEEEKNLLWTGPPDRDLLQRVKVVKRENRRWAHNNSEDAATWNVFHYFNRQRFLSSLAALFAFDPDGTEDIVYWSYSCREQEVLSSLRRARDEFGEEPKRSSEPDLIFRNSTSLVFVEDKLLASNRTRPTNPAERKRYLTGGNRWFEKAFRTPYEEVVFGASLYELMRFWLLGSWTADVLGLRFVLVNLVRKGHETDIETRFGQHIWASPDRQFMRRTWEDVFQIVSQGHSGPAARELLNWAREKTLGYNGQTRDLQPAFALGASS